MLDAQNGIIQNKDIYYLDDLQISQELNILKLGMNDSRVPSEKRIGPHNKNILDFITGSLLGEGGFLQNHGNGSKLCLQQEQSHKSYLLWLHKYLSDNGYCNSKIPEIKEKIGNQNKKRYVIRFKTWTYSSFNLILNKWYKNNKKILPFNIYISPLVLAIWIMNNGSRSGKGLKLTTNNFTYDECKILQDKLIILYDFKISQHKTGVFNQYNQYLHKESVNKCYSIISKYIHPSMKYKFNI